MENSSPTNSGPDSEAAYSVDELPSEEAGFPQAIPEDLSNKVAAATSYVGSFFNPSAWKSPSAERSPEAPEEPATASAGSSISSSLFSAIGKVPVPSFTKLSPTEETSKENDAQENSDDVEKTEDATPAGAGGFFSAFSKIGISGMSSSASVDNMAGKSPGDVAGEPDEKKKETWGNSLSQAFNKVGKVATDYSKGRHNPVLAMVTDLFVFSGPGDGVQGPDDCGLQQGAGGVHKEQKQGAAVRPVGRIPERGGAQEEDPLPLRGQEKRPPGSTHGGQL